MIINKSAFIAQIMKTVLHDWLVPNHVDVDLEVNVWVVLSLSEPKSRGNVSLKMTDDSNKCNQYLTRKSSWFDDKSSCQVRSISGSSPRWLAHTVQSNILGQSANLVEDYWMAGAISRNTNLQTLFYYFHHGTLTSAPPGFPVESRWA